MTQRHPLIPADIYNKLDPEVREFFNDLLGKLTQQQTQVKPTPQNSSVPPSTQHPHGKPKPKTRPKTKRKQGAQSGHKQATRQLVPSEQCDSVEPLKPSSCRRCHERLKGSDPDPLRHQVYELPEIKPIINEYQLHRLTCKKCGTQTCAKLPPGVPRHQCGPRLAALVGMLMGHYRQSKRLTAMFLSTLLKVPCSTGWVCKIQNTVSNALEQPYLELQKQLEKQEQLFVDESPTKQNKLKAWLWVAVASSFAVFGIFLNRKRTSLKQLIGDYSGIIINCDRAKMYHDGKTLQWCWSHLERDIQKLIDNPDRQVKRLGHDLKREQEMLFDLWHKHKNGQLSWRQFQTQSKPICKQFDAYLLRGAYSGNGKLMGMCEELYRHRDWLWTFTKVKGIEPTNNTAERALRPAVIYRKLSYGTQSAKGSRFIERMLTIIETCRLQQRSTMEYLVEAMKSHYNGSAPPSLLPEDLKDATKKPAVNRSNHKKSTAKAA